MYSPYYTDPMTRLSRMEQQLYPQTIQTIQGMNPQVQCFYVSAPSDMSNIHVLPGTVYIGLNESAHEVYMRQMNTDGNIDFKTFKLFSGTQEQTDMKAIALALEEIKTYIKGGTHESNVATAGTAVDVRTGTEQPAYVGVQ